MVFTGTRYPCSPPLIRFPPDDCFSSNDPEDNTVLDNQTPFKIETTNNKTSNLNYYEDVTDLEIAVSNPSLDNDVIIVESEEFNNFNSTSLIVNPVTNSTRKYYVIHFCF